MSFPLRNKLQYIYSFLFDTVVESTSSEYNKVLEVNYHNGKYLLDSKNVNYSYGKLEEVFDKTFKKIRIDKRRIENVLILGFGGGCVAKLLIQQFENVRITGVEIDPVVIDLANKYFGIETLSNLNLLKGDAIQFAESCTDQFDFIAVDLFINYAVPEQFYSTSFLLKLKKLLSPDGLIVFNCSIIEHSEPPLYFIVGFNNVFPGYIKLRVATNIVLVYEGSPKPKS